VNLPLFVRIKDTDVSGRVWRKLAHIDTEDSCWMNGHLGKRLHQR